MSKRFESVNKDFFSYIEDNRSGLLYCTTNHNDMKYLANLLNEQAQRIAELEEQLKNTIKLPCKIDDIVYWVDWDNTIKYGKVFEITVHIDGIIVHTKTRYCLEASKIFLTYKEAEENLEKFQKETQAKLEELQGESK